MKLFLAFFVLMTAEAMSLKDFNAKATHDQSVYVVDFIEKMTAELGAKNPQLAQDIRGWFSKSRKASRSRRDLSGCMSNSVHWKAWPMTGRSI